MEVQLYVYDLSQGMARMMSQQLLGIQIDAVYHTAVVLNQREYFFGAGIQSCRPGSTHHGQPMEIVKLGTTQLPQEVILEYLQSMKEIYTPESYDLFAHNCNNFSHDFAMFLLGKGIPAHITNLPQQVLDTPFGRAMRPTIDRSMRQITQAAPIPDSEPVVKQSGLLALGSKNAFLFSRRPPLDKLAVKLGDAANTPPFASLLTFIRERERNAADAALPDMPSICAAYQALDLPVDVRFAAVDLLRCAMLDVRIAGYLAEEQQTITALIRDLKDDSTHNLRLVIIQMLCNCFVSPIFLKQVSVEPIVQLISTSLLDEAHTTSRVAASWLAFNLSDAAYREQGRLQEDTQVELAASMIERLQSEQNDEAVRALLLALGRLVVKGGIDDLVVALDARATVLQCKLEKPLAHDVAKLLKDIESRQ